MFAFSPGGLVKVHECPECHDRGENAVDLRRERIRKAVRTEIRSKVS